MKQTWILSQRKLNIYTEWHFRVLLCVFDFLICSSAASSSWARSLGQKLLVPPAFKETGVNKVKRWHHQFTDFKAFLVETIRWKIVRFWCVQSIAFAGGTGRRCGVWRAPVCVSTCWWRSRRVSDLLLRPDPEREAHGDQACPSVQEKSMHNHVVDFHYDGMAAPSIVGLWP